MYIKNLDYRHRESTILPLLMCWDLSGGKGSMQRTTMYIASPGEDHGAPLEQWLRLPDQQSTGQC